MIGKTISHYKINDKLGSGGMGIVYKAIDTNLDRTVALKFLAPELTRDEEARKRLFYEAKAASSLDHPNICSIYEISETEEEQVFIAMAWYDGESLKEKIAKGPLKLEQAINYASQIATGLQQAHEKGIVHRDIKPANIMITKEDQVKIMDFGLAKLSGQTRLTMTGTTVGTVAYISPEQAVGEAVDHRTDIWSSGVVMYEMITGQLPFKGDYEQAIVYGILNESPEPLTGLRTGVSMELEGIVMKAMAKDPKHRYQHVDEIPVDLKQISNVSDIVSYRSTVTPAVKPYQWSSTWRQVLLWSLLVLLIIVCVWWFRKSHTVPKLVTRFRIAPPLAQKLSQAHGNTLAISPNGTHLVYVGQGNNDNQLYIRNLAEFEVRPIPGTERAIAPFFSPDGKWVAFFADGQLKKVSLSGGAPQSLCAAGGMGGCWGKDDTIIFTNIGLWRINANGGEPQRLTTAFKMGDTQELDHIYPHFLPGEETVIFTLWHGPRNIRIAVLSLNTGEYQTLIEHGGYARYVSTGHIVYAWSGGLFAAPFDHTRLERTGPPVSVLEDVRMDRGGSTHFSISENGSLVYVPGGDELIKRELIWVNNEGVVKPVDLPPDFYGGPRISPDGKFLTFYKWSEGMTNIWIYNLVRRTERRLTDDRGEEFWSVWTPNSKRVIFHSSRSGGTALNLHWKSMDGTGEAERLCKSEYDQPPYSVSSDGEYVAYQEFVAHDTWHDIWLLPLKGDRAPRPFLQTSASEVNPTISPDGRWLAYASDESGRFEVYVRPFPDAEDGLIPISTEGGMGPVWHPSGNKLFYRQSDKMFVVSFEDEPTLQVGIPTIFFKGQYYKEFGDWGRQFDLSRDGRRFLMIKECEQKPTPTEIIVVLNWFEELKSKVPSND